jgi:hypothetical protein
MRSRTTRLLAALPLAVGAALLITPAAQASTTPPTPAPPVTAAPAPAPPSTGPRVEASPAPVPGPATSVVPAEPSDGQVSRIPRGAPETGGGATAEDPTRTTALLALGGLGLAGAGTAVALRRRTGSTRG